MPNLYLSKTAHHYKFYSLWSTVSPLSHIHLRKVHFYEYYYYFFFCAVSFISIYGWLYINQQSETGKQLQCAGRHRLVPIGQYFKLCSISNNILYIIHSVKLFGLGSNHASVFGYNKASISRSEFINRTRLTIVSRPGNTNSYS